MKKIIIMAISLGFIPGIIWAQQKDSKKNTTSNSFLSRSRIVTFSQLDQRKIYNWGNGQRSTPTGRVAGEHLLSDYVRVLGDSAVVVKKPIKKEGV